MAPGSSYNRTSNIGNNSSTEHCVLAEAQISAVTELCK